MKKKKKGQTTGVSKGHGLLARRARVGLDDDHVSVTSGSGDIEEVSARPLKVIGLGGQETPQFLSTASWVEMAISSDHRFVVHRQEKRDERMDLRVQSLLVEMMLTLKRSWLHYLHCVCGRLLLLSSS